MRRTSFSSDADQSMMFFGRKVGSALPLCRQLRWESVDASDGVG
jgi:hypothetical protein